MALDDVLDDREAEARCRRIRGCARHRRDRSARSRAADARARCPARGRSTLRVTHAAAAPGGDLDPRIRLVAAVAHAHCRSDCRAPGRAARGRRGPAEGRPADRPSNSHWPPPRKWPALATAVSTTSAMSTRLARRDEAVGLDPRQAHQILDDPQHPPRFVADGAAEARAQLGGQVAAPRPASRHSRARSTAACAARGWRWRRNRPASSRPRRRRSGRSSGPAAAPGRGGG